VEGRDEGRGRRGEGARDKGGRGDGGEKGEGLGGVRGGGERRGREKAHLCGLSSRHVKAFTPARLPHPRHLVQTRAGTRRALYTGLRGGSGESYGLGGGEVIGGQV
jgi:hypothetical protein